MTCKNDSICTVSTARANILFSFIWLVAVFIKIHLVLFATVIAIFRGSCSLSLAVQALRELCDVGGA
jgi:hypothetical protein